MLSLRPGAASTVPRPRLTTAFRPRMRTVRSASRIGGKFAMGRNVVPLVSISTDSPSSGIGGPLCLKSSRGALPANEIPSDAVRALSDQKASLGISFAGNHDAFDHAAGNMLVDPCPNLAGSKKRPKPFQSRRRHASACDTESNVQFVAGIVETSGDRETNIMRRTRIDAAEIALLKFNTFPRGIDPGTYENAVDG